MEPQGASYLAPEKKPYVDKVQFRIYPDMNTAILALKKGDIDAIANTIPPAAVADLKNTPGIKIAQTASLGYSHITFNVRRPNAQALSEKAVRQAIATAINKQAIPHDRAAGQCHEPGRAGLAGPRRLFQHERQGLGVRRRCG